MAQEGAPAIAGFDQGQRNVRAQDGKGQGRQPAARSDVHQAGLLGHQSIQGERVGELLLDDGLDTARPREVDAGVPGVKQPGEAHQPLNLLLGNGPVEPTGQSPDPANVVIHGLHHPPSWTKPQDPLHDFTPGATRRWIEARANRARVPMDRDSDAKRILVVEPHRRLSLALASCLSGRGWQIEHAATRPAFIEATSRCGWEAVVIDDALPDADPAELCPTAKALLPVPAVIAVVAGHPTAARLRAVRSGADDVVVKPALTSEVVARVHLTVRRRSLAAAADQRPSPLPAEQPLDLGLGLLDAVQTLAAGGGSGTVGVAVDGGRVGHLSLRDGVIVEARVGPLSGSHAMRRLCRWTPARVVVAAPRQVANTTVMDVTSEELERELFEVREVWNALAGQLPLLQVLEADYPSLAALGGQLHPDAAGLLRLFDGRRRLLDVFDDAGLPDEDTRRMVAELLEAGLLTAGETTAEAAPPWEAHEGRVDWFFEDTAIDESTPVGRAKALQVRITPTPGAMGAVPGEHTAEPNGAAIRRKELSQTGTRLGWAAVAAGGSPFGAIASQADPALPSALPAEPSPPRDRSSESVVAVSGTITHPSVARPAEPSLADLPVAAETVAWTDPSPPDDDPITQRVHIADVMAAPVQDPPPSARSHSVEEWRTEAPPRRRALALAGMGAMLGMAGALFVWTRVGGPIAPAPDPTPPAASIAPAVKVAPVATPAANPAPAVEPPPAPPAVIDPVEEAAACRRAYARERYSPIIKACTLALENTPGQPSLMAMLAHAELDRGNFSRARSWARQALELDPKLPEAYAYLGFVEDQAGRRDEAMTAYRSYSEARAPRAVRRGHPGHRRSGRSDHSVRATPGGGTRGRRLRDAPMLVLGIETSCDETAAAVIEDGRRVRSDVVASQVLVHAEYGGVVPEVASRQHLATVVPVLRRAVARRRHSVRRPGRAGGDQRAGAGGRAAGRGRGGQGAGLRASASRWWG